MLRLKRIFQFIFLVGILTVAYSCTCVQTPKTDESEEKTDISAIDRESVMYLIPSPGEILERFHNTDIIFKKELINPVSNKDKYFGSMAQSVNLGVYITDLAYMVLFERVAETVDYLEIIKSLSYDVGISSNVFESLIERSRANAGNMDSLFIISNDAFNDLIDFLEEGGSETTVTLISAGAFIESLYLAINSVYGFSAENKVPGLIADMRYPLDNILERAKTIKNKDSVEGIISLLDPLSQLFNDLDTNVNGISINEQKGAVSIRGGSKPAMKEENFNLLKQKTAEIRNIIINY